MRWSHTAVTASCAANGQTDRPKLKLVPFEGVTSAGYNGLLSPAARQESQVRDLTNARLKALAAGATTTRRPGRTGVSPGDF